jgi:hypothetical protein
MYFRSYKMVQLSDNSISGPVFEMSATLSLTIQKPDLLSGFWNVRLV